MVQPPQTSVKLCSCNICFFVLCQGLRNVQQLGMLLAIPLVGGISGRLVIGST